MIYNNFSRDNKKTFKEDTTIEAALKTFEKFYKEKQYRQALDVLVSNKKDLHLAIYHHNMSSVLIQLKDFHLARYHVLMAESLGLNEKSLELNKEIISNNLDVERLESPITAKDYFFNLALSLPSDAFVALSLLLMILSLFIGNKIKSLKIWLLLSILVAVPTAFNFWLGKLPKFFVKNEARISDGPSEVFSTERKIPAGVMLIGDRNDEWIKIKYPSRFEGWIKDKDLLRINHHEL